MFLIQLIKKTFSWFIELSNFFMTESRCIAFWVTVISIASKILNIITFLLPLKIILIAASAAGIPEYLNFFSGSYRKIDWLIAMALATLFFYVFSLICEFFAETLIKNGSLLIFKKHTDALILIGLSKEKIQKYYKLIIEVWSGFSFLLICLCSIFFLNYHLFLICFGTFIVEIILSNHLIYSTKNSESAAGSYVLENTSGYLKILSSINFLFGFLIILTPYLFNSEANIILSIISLIVLRQGLNSFVSLISALIKLSKEKQKINMLIFGHITDADIERSGFKEQYELLEKSKREKWIRKKLKEFISHDMSISIEWMDPLFRDYSMLRITSDKPFIGGIKSIQLQVLGENWKHISSKEKNLFKYVNYKDIGAPRRLSTFEERGFICQAVDLEGAKLISRKDWNKIALKLLAQSWSYSPSDDLINYFLSIRKPIWQRFRHELIKPLFLAADNRKKVNALTTLLENIGVISRFLKSVPLYIFNPDVQPNNVFQSLESSRLIVPNWGRWSLEPIGFKLPLGVSDKELEECIASIECTTRKFNRDLTVSDVRLVNILAGLENLIKWQKYNSAFESVFQIIESSTFKEYNADNLDLEVT
ncbi:hypothetical protein OQJ59_01275 [Microbulbifer thermotolerans]|uniref:hypothetical protein n=1 Tax=Microbulbifer thermotolerans TaxID=252514 RepID=UPI00224B2CE8|nr:hypothetical protein [Microbulbifer thermotolerans]MCX2840250.1 hypothetical protein [Microbulbifer thermotolerans]